VEPDTTAPASPVDSFPADAAALIAVLPVTNLEQGTALTVTWTYNDTSMDNLTATVVAPARAPSTWIAFSLTAPPGTSWPTGTYAISVTVDGRPLQSSSTVVR
jgi:hypothetical protein